MCALSPPLPFFTLFLLLLVLLSLQSMSFGSLANAAAWWGSQVLSTKKTLGQPVLQGMEGENTESPLGTEQRLRHMKAGVQLIELVVYKYPQGLESFGGNV